MDVFSYNEYRAFIHDWEVHQTDRGIRNRLAQAAQCSPSWITRVLAGSVQLTPDQAFGIANLFHLNENELDYFLLLVDLERAATLILKKRIQKKLDLLKKESQKIASSVKSDFSINEENAARYYSSWVYSAIHVACMIKPQNVEELSNMLNLAGNIVSLRIKDLKEMGLLKIDGSRWSANMVSVHLPSTHPSSLNTHTSWRNRTIQLFHEGHDKGLHYSAVHCLSQKDIETVRKLLKKNILTCRDIIEKSPAEALGVLCMDWYEL